MRTVPTGITHASYHQPPLRRCADAPVNCSGRTAANTSSTSKADTSLTRRLALLSAAGLALVTSTSQPAAAAAPKPFCGVTGVPPWAFSLPWEERLIDFNGKKTWSRDVGQKGSGGLFGLFGSKGANKKLPLLVLHGGPGLPSRYLETLELLAGQGRRVIFYDQIGCGNSFLASGDTAPPLEDITPGLFLDELATVRAALGLSQARHHVLGHGWGGMLALDALSSSSPEQRGSIASLTLASVPPSYARLVADRQQRARELPQELQAALLSGGDAAEEGTTAQKAMAAYQRRYLTHNPGASCLGIAGQSAVVSQALCGVNPFQVGGAVKDWHAADGAAAVQQPVLLLRGDDEELSEGSFAELRALFKQPPTVSRFAGAASYIHIDAWEPFLETLNAFLDEHDAAVK